MSPRLAAHHSAIYLHAELFARIDALHAGATSSGSTGAAAPRSSASISISCAKARGCPPPPRRVTRRSSSASQSSRRDSARTCWPTRRATGCSLRDERDLAGLPDDVRAAAREAAQRTRRAATPWIDHAVTLADRAVSDVLGPARSARAGVQGLDPRGENDGEHDNRPIAREILALRNEQARLHGYAHYADYALVDRMAGTPDAVARSAARRSGSRPRRARRRSAMRCAAMALSHGANACDRALGLALLRREGAQGALRLRRRRAEAVLLARSDAGGGVRHAPTACSASRSSSGPISAPITPTCASSRCAARDGGWSACS